MRAIERKVLQGVACSTIATGSLQVAMPGKTLAMMGVKDSPTARHLFAMVGMFMTCTGGAFLARPDDRAVAAMTVAQKLGAATAIGIGVQRGLFSTAALGVVGFDGVSGLLALDYLRRLP
jgi:hypothetical protein